MYAGVSSDVSLSLVFEVATAFEAPELILVDFDFLGFFGFFCFGSLSSCAVGSVGALEGEEGSSNEGSTAVGSLPEAQALK